MQIESETFHALLEKRIGTTGGKNSSGKLTEKRGIRDQLNGVRTESGGTYTTLLDRRRNGGQLCQPGDKKMGLNQWKHVESLRKTSATAEAAPHAGSFVGIPGRDDLFRDLLT